MNWTYITLIFFFIGILAFGFYAQDFIATTAVALDGQMLVVERELNGGRHAHALKLIDGFLEDWDRTENKWSLFINHAEIDNIEMSIAKITQFIAKKEDASALAEIATVRSLLKHIPEREKLHPLNIL